MARTNDDVARTRMLWAANKPGETAAPAYVPDPPVFWHLAIALVLALVVQTSIAPWFTLRGAAPSLVTLLVAWYGVRTGTLRGFVFGLIAGACEDAFAGSSGVAWTFATGLAGALCGRFARTWLADTKLALVPGAGIVTFVRYGAFALMMQVQGRPLALPLTHFHVVLWQSAFDLAIAFVVLRIFPRLGGSDAHRR
jgi:cell shape-determining protein MreD